MERQRLKFSGSSTDLFLVVVSVQDLCDPTQCSLDEAIRIARQRSRERQAYDLQIAQYLNEHWRAHKVDPGIVERALTLLSETAPPARVFGLLRTAMSHYDPHVRSKAAVALARRIDSTAWLEKLSRDEDPRVRANTIESFWGRTTSDIESMLAEALNDSHHRVAANAAYGLYLIDPVKYLAAVAEFVDHSQPRYRRAGAWVIAKTRDAALMPLLKQLLFDKVPEVKHAAFRTLTVLRGAAKAAAA